MAPVQGSTINGGRVCVCMCLCIVSIEVVRQTLSDSKQILMIFFFKFTAFDITVSYWRYQEKGSKHTETHKANIYSTNLPTTGLISLWLFE